MTNSPDDLETERRVRSALRARSERVVMSRPWPSDLSPRREGFQRGGVRLALAAASVAGLVGIGVVLWSGSGDESSDVATIPSDAPTESDTSADDEGAEDPDPPPPSADSESTPDPDSDEVAVERDPSGLPSVYGPVTFTDRGDYWLVEPQASPSQLLAGGLVLSDDGARTGEEAALVWLSEELDIEAPRWLAVGLDDGEDRPAAVEATSGVSRLGEGGRAMGLGLMVGTASTPAGDWFVTHVVSDLVWIDSVERNGELTGSLRITGGGWAFEGTGLLLVDDAEPVIVSVGAGQDPGRFSVVVPWDGDGTVEVRIVAPAIADGSTPATTAFVAVPSDPATEISVVGVADDDVLNVRSGPGTANDVVTTLEPDATGVTHTGAIEQVDGELWWEIVTPPPAGETGWVNRRFIAVAPAVDPDSVLAQGMFALAGAALRDLGPDAVGLSLESRYSERIEVGGIGVWADASHALQTRDPLQLDTDVFWEPPFEMNECVECTKSVREFVGIRERDIAEAILTVGPGVDFDDNWRFTHGLSPDFYSRYATVVAYTPPSDPQETLDWSRYTFIFDFVDGAPEIRAIHRWGWTP